MEYTHHYADVRPAETYADRRVLIIGKQNSGFELATGLLPWARQLILMSPSQARLSVETKTLVGVRARYVQPYEDYVLGGGVSVLDAAIDRIEPAGDGRLTVHLRRTDGGADLAVEVDDVISATGFVTPLQDLPELGVDDVRGQPAARPDAVVGERDGARASTSPARSARARRASRSTACRPTPARSTARATTPASSPAGSPRRTSGSSRSGRTSRPATIDRLHRDRAGRGARAVPPARLPRPRPDRRPGRRGPRRRGPAARLRPRQRRARMRSRRPSRPTGPGRSTRSSTPGSAARSSSRPSSRTRSCASTRIDARRAIAELAGRVMAR